MPSMFVIVLALALFGIGYFVSAALRTGSAVPTLVLLALSVTAFGLLYISFYLGLVVADETGTEGGPGVRDAILSLLTLGFGIASLVVHLRARRSHT